MKDCFKLLHFRSILLLVFNSLLLWNCGSSKTNDPTPSSTTTPSQSTTGYITAELNGKAMEFKEELDAYSSADGYDYNLKGTIADPNYDLEYIGISLAALDKKVDVNTLKGIHKSSDKVNGNISSVSIYYSVFSYSTKKTVGWSADQNCTVEITSTTSPWIEGTFTVDNALTSSTTAITPITIKKGTFKIKYQ